MKTIGERIKRARLGQGLSQSELASAAEVSQPTIANWENGSHIPRQPALMRLSEILQTSSHWFLGSQEANDTQLIVPRAYLETPIQHVPILSWPRADDVDGHELKPSPAYDFIAVSTNANKPFALIANDPAMAARFPIGAIVIFDANVQTLESGACYLFAHNGHIILRSWQNAPDRLEALPNQSAVDAEFINVRPTPLARALMSIRKH